MKKVLITGASGMVGKGVLLECLEHPEIAEVLSIGRSKLDLTHPKLKQLVHADFSEFNSIMDQLVGYDACYHCMGVSAARLSEADYTRMTYDYTMALAKTLYGLNPNMTFIYVSGQGTNSTEKGRQMWARVKGKTENDLMALGFANAYMFRPGAILPLKGIEPSSKMYRVLIKNLKWLIKLIKKMSPNSVVDTTQIGLAMIALSTKNHPEKIINPIDIIALAKHEKR